MSGVQYKFTWKAYSEKWDSGNMDMMYVRVQNSDRSEWTEYSVSRGNWGDFELTFTAFGEVSIMMWSDMDRCVDVYDFMLSSCGDMQSYGGFMGNMNYKNRMHNNFGMNGRYNMRYNNRMFDRDSMQYDNDRRMRDYENMRYNNEHRMYGNGNMHYHNDMHYRNHRYGMRNMMNNNNFMFYPYEQNSEYKCSEGWMPTDFISGMDRSFEGGMGNWDCYNYNNGDYNSDCYDYDSYFGRQNVNHKRGYCTHSQGGLEQSFSTMSGRTYKFTWKAYSDEWENDDMDMMYVRVRNSDKSEWTQYSVSRGNWGDFELTFTAYGQVSITMWSDVDRCVDVYDFMLSQCGDMESYNGRYMDNHYHMRNSYHRGNRDYNNYRMYDNRYMHHNNGRMYDNGYMHHNNGRMYDNGYMHYNNDRVFNNHFEQAVGKSKKHGKSKKQSDSHDHDSEDHDHDHEHHDHDHEHNDHDHDHEDKDQDNHNDDSEHRKMQAEAFGAFAQVNVHTIISVFAVIGGLSLIFHAGNFAYNKMHSNSGFKVIEEEC